jgi:ssRNA-specific RNase YbeY (16S rRNA maturation enzyme)
MQGLLQAQIETVRETLQRTYACEKKIRSILEKTVLQEENAKTILRCLCVILTSEAELVALTKEWDRIPSIIDVVSFSLPLSLHLLIPIHLSEYNRSADRSGGHFGSRH